MSKQEAQASACSPSSSACGITDPERTFDSYPHQISGGMAQRVLIAGAVASRPQLLIADEPTTALDVTVQAEILDLLRDLQTELDMAVLLVTHNFGVVADICDRIASCRTASRRDGADGRDLPRTRSTTYTKMLLGAILDDGDGAQPTRLPSRDRRREACDDACSRSRDLRVALPRPRLPGRSPSEVLHGVSPRRRRTARRSASSASPASGKTTIGRAVLGLVKPSGGHDPLRRRDITHLTGTRTPRAWPSDIQVVFQDPYTSLNPSLTIGDILTEPLVVQGPPRRTPGAEFGRCSTRSACRRTPPSGCRASSAAASASASPSPARWPREPKLIVCDEPVSALDLSTQARVLDLFIDIQRATGVAYLFISHDLAVVRHISHRVAVLYRGDIVETGPAAQVTSAPEHPYTQRLLLAAPVADPIRQRAPQGSTSATCEQLRNRSEYVNDHQHAPARVADPSAGMPHLATVGSADN